MKSRPKKGAPPAGRTGFRLASAAVLLLSLADPAFAQEGLGFPLPDSNKVVRESFFVPSLSPSLSFTTPEQFENRLSLADRAMITPDKLFNVYHDAWRRSFLLGATDYKAHISQASPWMARKETFFQRIQAILGVAELAGVAYLGYKAIKKEPITKKK